MTGHTAFLARLGIVKLILVVGISILLIPRMGGIGMVIAMGVGYLSEGVVGISYAWSRMRAKEQELSPVA